jgi:hypothetical protein
MRDKLIKMIIEMSTRIYDDDLDWMDFRKYSNDELLFMYAKVSIDEYVMNTLQGVSNEKEKH